MVALHSVKHCLLLCAIIPSMKGVEMLQKLLAALKRLIRYYWGESEPETAWDESDRAAP